MEHRVAALDIGGANLKAAHSQGAASTQAFALWKNPGHLAGAIIRLLGTLPPFETLAITMTGELCDCFANKRDGVLAILDAVAEAAPGVPTRVWQTDGRLVTLSSAREAPRLAAASNWLALATYCTRQTPNACGFVIDIGSTTTDIIPIANGRPIPRGRTDRERLRERELIYTGARRTPLCALMGSQGAAEFFASTLDLYLCLEWVNESPADCDTADGRPATRAAALARLARMLCADPEDCSESELAVLAQDLADRQIATIVEGITSVTRRLPEPPTVIFIAGAGEFVARRAIAKLSPPHETEIFSFAEHFGPEVSTAACAFSLAKLAAASGLA